jgi:spore maturation protein CgeB
MMHRYIGGFRINDKRSLSSDPNLIFVADVFRKLEGLASFSCPKAYYVQDPHASLQRYLDFANVQEYDYVFVTQKDSMEYFRRHGCKNVTWLPWGFDHDIIVDYSERRDIEIVFCGTVYPGSERERLVKLLENKFGLVSPRVYLRDMVAVLRRSKIAFNKSAGGDLNLRVFESLGAGALVLTDRVDNGLLDLF